ncbi:hypothetical protein [Algibacter sp. 2305UL17-15]|uniref:hypothetical protein n=1 Tax=Algibacter sp. 2305UL17-15 TaxID=3231268 RepID=UPI00345AA100
MKSFKLVSVLFSILICFHSCRVYHHKSVTLEEAVKTENRVKIKTIGNKTIKFKKIVFENNLYYGIRSNKYGKLLLNEDELNKIRLYNPNLSMVYTIIFVPTLIITLTVGLFVITYSGPELGNGIQFPN